MELFIETFILSIYGLFSILFLGALIYFGFKAYQKRGQKEDFEERNN